MKIRRLSLLIFFLIMYKYCYICYSQTDIEMICDRCEEHYCDDCSYTFSLHYQFQGSRCYSCAGQGRKIPTKNEIRIRKIDIIIE